MSRLATVLRWSALHALRPYLRNPLLDKGKWFLVGRLNPAPGLEEDWAPLGTRVCRMRGGARIRCEMVYAADRALYFTGEYEVASTRLLLRILDRGWRFVDVGANVGKYTLLAAAAAREVIAVEPNPVSLERLRANLALNGFANVELLTCGLSDARASASLHQDGKDIGGATLLADRAFTDACPIEVRPGDEALPASALRTYLKVDVEGLEYRVLRGCRALLAGRRALVQVEVTDRWLRADGASAHELFAFMRTLGYAPFRAVHRTRLRTRVDVERLDAPLGLPQYDAIFAPAEDREAFWRWVGRTGHAG